MSDNTDRSFFVSRGRFLLVPVDYGSGVLYGKFVSKETLFQNLKDYWSNSYNPNRQYFWWLEILMPKLERKIRRKWTTDLPYVNILLEGIRDKDQNVNLLIFSEDSESYFLSIIKWKEKKEGCYFKPTRHKKILGTAKPIRG